MTSPNTRQTGRRSWNASPATATWLASDWAHRAVSPMAQLPTRHSICIRLLPRTRRSVSSCMAARGSVASPKTTVAAELFVRAGTHYVVLDFINVIEAGGDLMPMAAQVRCAIAWVYRNATSFGGDPNRIHLYGHSSGAHLAGVAMVTDWRGSYDLPTDVIKTGLLCSGMYDLRPVRLSARSRYVNFTDDMEVALSTQRHIDRFTAPVVLAFGTLETPEFQRQSRDFAATLRAAGKRVELLVGHHYNHFEIVETLASPYGLLGRAALAQIAAQ